MASQRQRCGGQFGIDDPLRFDETVGEDDGRTGRREVGTRRRSILQQLFRLDFELMFGLWRVFRVY